MGRNICHTIAGENSPDGSIQAHKPTLRPHDSRPHSGAEHFDQNERF